MAGTFGAAIAFSSTRFHCSVSGSSSEVSLRCVAHKTDKNLRRLREIEVQRSVLARRDADSFHAASSGAKSLIAAFAPTNRLAPFSTVNASPRRDGA